MGLFKEIATPLVARNVPVIPLRPKTKVAFLTDWDELASTDIEKINKWDEEYKDANAACVARASEDGVWFLEIDRAGYASEIEKETGHLLPETFMVRSSPGRGHFYFKQTDASIKMGNVKVKDDEGKELWSARVNNAYVVAPGSYHPTSGKRYETLRDTQIIPAPDWLIKWCESKRKNDTPKTGHAELDDSTPFPEGSRNNSLTSLLGKARQVMKMNKDELLAYGLIVNQNRCKPPLSEEEVRTIANSMGRYEIKLSGPETVTLNGVPASQPTVQSQPIVVERPSIKAIPYPVFPRWVMKGTSIYDGLVEPVCKVNSRYPEFMFMPAVVLMMNYLALKVKIEYKALIPSFFLVCIGRKGRVIKSSSVEDAIAYLDNIGIISHASSATKNAEGKSLVFTVGSPEGLGLEMERTNCKNAVLLYDELATLVAKAGIDGSTLQTNLLSMYESGKFSNRIKSRRESYNFDPNTYCASLIACTTDKNFLQHWSKMAGGSSGLDERFFFLYQPEVLDPLLPFTLVDTKPAAQKTKQLIDKAIKQSTYMFDDMTMLEQSINRLGNRAEIRAEKLALYFAIDMGKDTIDESCVERAIAICDYELAVKKYLRTFESTTKEGAIQNEIIQLLQRNAGSIAERDLNRVMHPERHGTSLWYSVYNGLLRSGWIAEQGKGTKGDPKIIILLRVPEEDD